MSLLHDALCVGENSLLERTFLAGMDSLRAGRTMPKPQSLPR